MAFIVLNQDVYGTTSIIYNDEFRYNLIHKQYEE